MTPEAFVRRWGQFIPRQHRDKLERDLLACLDREFQLGRRAEYETLRGAVNGRATHEQATA